MQYIETSTYDYLICRGLAEILILKILSKHLGTYACFLLHLPLSLQGNLTPSM